MPKITDYTAKTAFDDGDLYDCSTYDGVSAYATEKVTWLQLKNELSTVLTVNSIYTADDSLTAARTVTLSASNTLTFTGGLTTFKGQDATSSNFAAKILKSTSGIIAQFRNDGLTQLGTSLSSTSWAGSAYNQINSFSLTDSTVNGAASTFDFTYTPTVNNTKSNRSLAARSNKQGATNTSTVQGAIIQARQGGTGQINNLFGTSNAILINSTGTVLEAYASEGENQITAASTTTNMGGFRSFLSNFTTGTVTNYHGFIVETPVNSGASITNTYGLRIKSNTFGTNNFGVVQEGSTMDNKFEGAIFNLPNLPTSSAGLAAGDLWNNSGVINIV